MLALKSRASRGCSFSQLPRPISLFLTRCCQHQDARQPPMTSYLIHPVALSALAAATTSTEPHYSMFFPPHAQGSQTLSSGSSAWYVQHRPSSHRKGGWQTRYEVVYCSISLIELAPRKENAAPSVARGCRDNAEEKVGLDFVPGFYGRVSATAGNNST